MPATFTTVRGVPLAKVGDWPTYRGNGKITRENLADAVAASKDTQIREALEGDPRGWLGHVDGADVAAARQNEPAVGRVTNLTLADDGDTLIGDVEDIPEAVVKHYPWRSVELHPNVSTPGGKTYSRVLTGLAHLGRVKGAVRGLGALDDLAKGLEGAPTLAAQGDAILFSVWPTDPAGHENPLGDEPEGRTVDGMTDPTPEPEGTTPTPTPEGEDATTPKTPPKPTTPKGTNPPADDDTDGTVDPNAVIPGETPADEPTAAATGPSTVTVSKAVWDRTQARLSALEDDKQTRETAARESERDTAIAAALREGRIAPTDKDETVSYFSTHGNAAGLDLLKRLPKGLAVPVGEVGTSADVDPIEAAGAYPADKPLPDDVSIRRHVRKPRNRKGGR